MNKYMGWKGKGILDPFKEFLACGGLKGFDSVGVCKVIRLEQKYWHDVLLFCCLLYV
jgi:hypothetical protein